MAENRNTQSDSEKTLGTLRARFAPIFSKIASGAITRELEGQLPYEPVEWLKECRFTALRVPIEHGGFGATISQAMELVADLAEADSNVAQIFRGHFAFVEDRLNDFSSTERDSWFERFVSGQLVCNAWTDAVISEIGKATTVVTERDGRLVVSGCKYYSTGNIFADWFDLLATRSGQENRIYALISADQLEVVKENDWTGFGQRTSASGMTTFTEAQVDKRNIFALESRFRYQPAFFQIYHLAILHGIGIAAERELILHVQARNRVFSHGNAEVPAKDVQIQQVIGEVSSLAYAIKAVLHQATSSLQVASEYGLGKDSHHILKFAKADSALTGNAGALEMLNINAEIEVSKAQVLVSEFVLRICNRLFDALAASATSSSRSLDRHWRNARTIVSHNPTVYKSRIVGAWEVCNEKPPPLWQVGLMKNSGIKSGEDDHSHTE
jgi:alkylation response protein AidB-like acyl-CoA dehydrogenase